MRLFGGNDWTLMRHPHGVETITVSPHPADPSVLICTGTEAMALAYACCNASGGQVCLQVDHDLDALIAGFPTTAPWPDAVRAQLQLVEVDLVMNPAAIAA